MHCEYRLDGSKLEGWDAVNVGKADWDGKLKIRFL